MKMTLLQRLNTALMLMILLLLVAGGLALWIEKTSQATEINSAVLSGAKDRIYYDVASLSESIRGLLLDPRNAAEKKRRTEAEEDLKANFKNPPDTVKEHPQLLGTLEALREFTFRTLFTFHDKALKMLDTDQPGAIAFYNQSYPAIAQQREQLFRDLSQQIDGIKNTEARQAARTVMVGGIGIIIVLIASLFVGLFQSTAVSEPLSRLVSALERMRQGDFTNRLNMKRHDEFGVLSDGLNRLADDLSQLVGQVQRSGIQVNTTATEIAATAKQQQTTAHEIAATTAEIGATSKEISATSKELEKTMNEVNDVAEETAHLAGSGQTGISRMETTMRHIMDAAGSITAKLAVLSEKTTNINSVVTTITKVADQTNLLSLNAAIEAEKAGEYGLGFAVVAMEIRRLADQTAVATYDIEKMVKEMQSAVAAGVMGMDKFSEEVRRGVEEIRQVSTHLAQIIHQVQTLTPRFQTVNEGMHAQATGAQQISETLTQLSEAAHQTAESLRQSNLAIEQLNGAARGLQTSVARFKLSEN
jgi:methyl-accepting chemotaxis protein WspA